MSAATKTRAVKRSNPGGGKSPAELVRKSNQWRDSYNPLRSLVISRVVAMLEAAERGDFAELQLTLRKVEKRYPVLKALIARRCGAIEKLNWDVKVPEVLPDGVTPEMAEGQRAHLRARYDLVENLTDAFGQLAMAEFRGFTLLQKHRFTEGEHDGAVRELHWLPQFIWCRDGQFGDFYYNADCRFGITAPAVTLGAVNHLPLRPPQPPDARPDSLSRSDFIFRECDSPLYEIALIAFVNWCMGRKDWAAFVEIFGLPNAIVILPANIPQGSEDEYRTAAEKVADGVSGALPNGSDAKFPAASVRGNAPFKEFCDAMDADLILAGTGGLLTMLSLPQGIGGGASGEHGDAFADIAQADARRITSTLQRDFDGPELDEAFPGQPHLAYFELAAEAADDTDKLVANAVALKGAGYAVKGEWLAERTGYELVEGTADHGPQTEGPGALVSDPAGPGQDDERAGSESGAPLRNRAAAQPSTLNTQLRAAFAADLQPARERLARILSISDDALLETKLREFVAEFPQLVKDITADPSAARVLEKHLGTAATQGLASGAPLSNRRVRNSGEPGHPFYGNQHTDGAGGGGDAGEAGKRLGGLYDSALKERSGNEQQIVKWKPVDAAEAAMLKAATNLDVAGCTHAVDNYAIRHVDKSHGDPARELPRGQLPVTRADWEALPHTLTTADKIENGGRTKLGREAIRYTKHSGGTTVVVEEVRTKQKLLVPVSIKKFKGRVENRATNNAQAPFSTSETLRPDELVAPSAEEIKP